MNNLFGKNEKDTLHPLLTEFKDIFNIHSDAASPAEIRERVVSNAKFKGTNMYVLIIAIIIASIGLNMNSTAVIIGAMLISPLMGSLIGIGYGMGTKQSEFTKTSFIGLLLQLTIALITSTLYFLISPITAPSEEILARTSPTIWDVLIAFFGGMAGIIGLTRKDKSNNIIPGVAIATALMPPICTAGYGLANGKFHIFLGALDLFLINCLCIFITAFIFTKILKINDTPDDIKMSAKKITVYLSVFALLVLVPSCYYAYAYVSDSSTENSISTFVSKEFKFEDTQVIKTNYDRNEKILTVSLVGQSIEDEQIEQIKSKLPEYELSDISLKVTQTKTEKTISIEEVNDIITKRLSSSEDEISTLKTEIAQLEQVIDELEAKVEEAEKAVKESQTEPTTEKKKKEETTKKQNTDTD